MVAGHLQEKKGYFYMVLNYSVGGKRKTKWLPTGLVVKGNKKKQKQCFGKRDRPMNPKLKKK